MGWRVGAQDGGMTDSLNMPDARLVEREQVERLARLVSAAKTRPRAVTREEDAVVTQIQVERARHERRRAAWQKEAGEHRAKIDALLRKLEAMQAGLTTAMGAFERAFAKPRIAGRARAEAMARRMGRSM